jgi:hypothetical protein
METALRINVQMRVAGDFAAHGEGLLQTTSTII